MCSKLKIGERFMPLYFFVIERDRSAPDPQVLNFQTLAPPGKRRHE